MDRYYDSLPYPTEPMTPLERLSEVCSRELKKLQYEEYVKVAIFEWEEKKKQERISTSTASIQTQNYTLHTVIPASPSNTISIKPAESSRFVQQRQAGATSLAMVLATPPRPVALPFLPALPALPTTPLLVQGAVLYYAHYDAGGAVYRSSSVDAFGNVVANLYASGPSVDANANHVPPPPAPEQMDPRKPHRCHLCPKGYTKGAHLRAHLLAHAGSRPFRCGWQGCTRSFVRRDELGRHVRVHTGERAHHCAHCARAFRRSDHLKKHVRTQHPAAPPPPPPAPPAPLPTPDVTSNSSSWSGSTRSTESSTPSPEFAIEHSPPL